MQTPSRQILWNIDSFANVIAMYSLMTVCLAIAALGILRHIELWTSGKKSDGYLGNYLGRAKDLWKFAALQHGVIRDRAAAIAHTLIYLGFLVLLFTTTMVFIDHDLGIKIYQGDFYLVVTVLSDMFGFGLLIGCGIAAHRRYIKQPDKLHNRASDSFVLIILALLIIQGFVLEGLRIHVTNDPWKYYSPIGLGFAKLFWFLSEESSRLLHFTTWWFHTITVFFVMAILPYTKFFHIIASSINLYFRKDSRAKGQLDFPGDLQNMLEAGEEFSLGTETIKDYTWKNLLDLDACTSCGRCQNECPAYNSGKVLSPKWMILDTRNHALLLNSDNQIGNSKLPKFLQKIDKFFNINFLMRPSGLRKAEEGYAGDGEFRANNKAVQSSVLKLGSSANDKIAGDVMNPDVFWNCTTCYACVEACPVGINHVDQIIANRRNMLLMRGELPSEAQATLRSLENRGNPYGAREDRTKWMSDLDVKIVQPGDEIEYLYWVGCVSAYDQRKQKIARSLVKIFNQAKISWGTLGVLENCTGDPARRLGEEVLYQSLAKQNIELLRSIKFKYIVANCPHCFNTIKNEYPDLGLKFENDKVEIIHHSRLLKQLLDNKQINVNGADQDYTFHDPCYLGRYNDEYEAPRDTIKKVKGLKVIEMEKSRNKGMCCGAGGGHFWMDLKQGERINVKRVEQAAETGASKIATACPFCMQMMEDGVKLTNRSEQMEVKDIAEVIAENLS